LLFLGAKFMDTLLRIVGGIWAIIGAANIIMMPWNKSGEGLLAFGLIFNVLLFIIPGLILYGIGAGISKKRAATSQSSPSTSLPKGNASIEARLQQLEDLKDRGVIRPEEYEARRADILREL
jgi:hypothetical protein